MQIKIVSTPHPTGTHFFKDVISIWTPHAGPSIAGDISETVTRRVSLSLKSAPLTGDYQFWSLQMKGGGVLSLKGPHDLNYNNFAS